MAGAAKPGRPPATFAFLDFPFPIPFAHRGGRGPHPENTAAAFQHAVDLGYRYLETDARATRDGTLVAFHDPDLARMCGVNARLVDLPWRTVSQARVAGREPIPLFEDLLGTWPEARFNIDVKDESAIDPLVRAIRRTSALERVCVGSFSSRRIDSVRRALGPDLCTSAGATELAVLRARSYPWSRRNLGRKAAIAPVRAAAAQVPIRAHGVQVIDRRFISFLHLRGVHVHAWTINNHAEIASLLDLGIDGIMTDELQLLKSALRDRDLWSD